MTSWCQISKGNTKFTLKVTKLPAIGITRPVLEEISLKLKKIPKIKAQTERILPSTFVTENFWHKQGEPACRGDSMDF
jgi:hypothetical protein